MKLEPGHNGRTFEPANFGGHGKSRGHRPLVTNGGPRTDHFRPPIATRGAVALS